MIQSKKTDKVRNENEPFVLPIDGVLDLHTFNPREVKDLIPEYLEECRKRGIYHVRIIHGKGTGTLKRIVESLLKKNAAVAEFKTAGLGGGSWGATEVILHRGISDNSE
ncbi:MAG: Smr/MutS family protein [Candidatus Aminicenantes bacterium]|nr:Smr/MutS family protein [Candidatus Aminicenantes bacterium]